MTRHAKPDRAVEWTTRRAVVALAAAVAVLAGSIIGLAAASGGSGTASAGTPVTVRGLPSVSAELKVTRWWTVPGEPAGSRIDPQHPTAIAGGLHPSRAAYCGSLRQTVDARHTLLPPTGGNDPALVLTAEAFVSEMAALAPQRLHPAWRSMGTVVLEFVRSRGDLSSVPTTGAATVASATRAIASDARTACHVDLSS